MSDLPANEFGLNIPLHDQESLVEMLGIRPADRVLEIGGAANPFHRADTICDLTFASSAQRNGAPGVLREGVTYVEGSAESLPFADAEFDFVYCTQVMEHVRDPEAACREISRVARRGFVEVPSRLGELVNGNPSHRWLVDREGQVLVFTPRTFLEHPLKNFFYGAIFGDEELRRISEQEYRNLFNHQVLFESPLRCRVAVADGRPFDYEDPEQAGRAHYSFARNVLSAGGDPAYTLPDAIEAVRLLPGARAPKLLQAASLGRLGRRAEALTVLKGTDGAEAESLRRVLERLVSAGHPGLDTLPLPPADPLALGAIDVSGPRSRPRVTVVVVGDDPSLCRIAADSALTQDYPDVEVIVSSSSSAEALRRAFDGLFMGDRLRLIPQAPDSSLGVLLNKGCIEGRGDVIAFLLEGDRYQTHHLDRMVAQLQIGGVEAVHGDVLLAETGHVLCPDVVPDDPATADASLSTLVITRDALVRGGGFEEDRGDSVALRRLVLLAREGILAHVREPTVESRRLAPTGAAMKDAVSAGSSLDPLALVRSLMASYVREKGLRATIEKLERRLSQVPRESNES